MSDKKRDNLSAAQHTAIGGVAGTVECCIMQPTVAVKNALQEGRPLPANPAAYYRGLLVNAGSIAPITAIQFGAHRALEKFLRDANGGQELAKVTQIAAASAAGATSSLVGCPAELIMIQQQKSGNSLVGEASRYLSAHGTGKLFRGFLPTATRDGFVTAGYLGISPALQSIIDESPSFSSLPASVRFCMAGITTGCFVAMITQPADTIKTRMQAFPNIERRPEYTSIRSTARDLIQTQGVLTLWAGLLPRLIRISGAMIILQVVRKQLVSMLDS